MNGSAVRICRDQDCPDCGYPETFAEVDFTLAEPGARALGCDRCGWRIEAEVQAR